MGCPARWAGRSVLVTGRSAEPWAIWVNLEQPVLIYHAPCTRSVGFIGVLFAL